MVDQSSVHINTNERRVEDIREVDDDDVDLHPQAVALPVRCDVYIHLRADYAQQPVLDMSAWTEAVLGQGRGRTEC